MNNQKSSSMKFLRDNSKIVLCLVLIVILFIIGNALTGGQFATPLVTMKFASFIALFGLGQMLIICAGGYIDLSVGYNATLVSCLTVGVMNGTNEGLFLSIVIAVVVGAVIGLINGLLSVNAKLPSLVVTLAMQQMLQGIVNLYTTGNSLSGGPSPIVQQMIARSTGQFPNIIFLMIVLTVIVMLVLYKTKIGFKLVACGSNETNAHLSGIRVNLVRIGAFIACGIIAGLMGIVLLGNLGSAFKDMASSYVMPSIAAVVIGGLSINGGNKNYIGVILGAFILQTLTNMFVALGWGDAGRYLGYGLVLLIMLIVYVREKVSR
jgi:ribose transport system permease protein